MDSSPAVTPTTEAPAIHDAMDIGWVIVRIRLPFRLVLPVSLMRAAGGAEATLELAS